MMASESLDVAKEPPEPAATAPVPHPDPTGHGRGLDRRAFLALLGAGAAGIGVRGGPGLSGPEGQAEAAPNAVSSNVERRAQAEKIRIDAATLAARRPLTPHPNNGEERLYENKIASYSKGLPHNQLGEVDLDAYQTLLSILTEGTPADYEKIPLGLGRRLTNPQAALAFDLEGADSHHLAIPPAPTIAGAQATSETAELYWMALVRDVNFAEYGSDPIIAAAADELTRLSDFRGPKIGGRVTPDAIFRGNTRGDLIGPYLSQFLWMDIPMGAVPVVQRMQTAMPGIDYLTSYTEWLDIQNGAAGGANQFDATPRYIRNLRDLAQWVHVDALYQAYHQASLILLGMGAPFDPGNPYVTSATQIGFGTFGGPHLLTLVTEVATRALKAVWYQKWLVHRRLRPEAMGGLVHHTRAGAARYPVNPEILHSRAVDRVFTAHGTYLLPGAYPEGSPTHPSYGAGHATVAGACVTILKAWFDESFVLPNPVVPDPSGLSLAPYVGPDLTVGNELNKLAANVALGRNAAGIHYRSDYAESLRLGEAVALTILEEQKATYHENATFTLMRFDGTTTLT